MPRLVVRWTGGQKHYNVRIDPVPGPLTWAAEHLFNLKFAAKELNRNSKKCDKEEKAEKAKIKKVSGGPETSSLDLVFMYYSRKIFSVFTVFLVCMLVILW